MAHFFRCAASQGGPFFIAKGRRRPKKGRFFLFFTAAAICGAHIGSMTGRRAANPNPVPVSFYSPTATPVLPEAENEAAGCRLALAVTGHGGSALGQTAGMTAHETNGARTAHV